MNAEDCQNIKNQNVSAINHANSISSGWCIHFLGDSFLGVSNFGDTWFGLLCFGLLILLGLVNSKKIIQCHPYQNDTFHLHRNWQKNHSCEIPFTMLKIHEVNICYMDLYLILSIFIPNFDVLNIFLIFFKFLKNLKNYFV